MLRILSSGLGYPLTVTKKSNPSPPQPSCTTKHRQRIKTHTTPTNTAARSNQTTRIQPTTTRCSGGGGGGGGGKDELAAVVIGALQSKTQTPSKRVSKTRNTQERKKPTFERENGEEDLAGSNAGREEEGRRKEEVTVWGGGDADMARSNWGCLGMVGSNHLKIKRKLGK